MNYAVIQTGSKQYIVETGSVVSIEKLDREVGKDVSFKEIPLYVKDGKVSLGTPFTNCVVSGKVVDQIRDKKKQGIKYQNSGGFRTKFGHRQQKTLVEITEISAKKRAEK